MKGALVAPSLALAPTNVSGYKPRKAFLAFHARNQTRAVLVIHRRAGKTVACVNDLVDKALQTSKPNAMYAYVGPFAKQTAQVAWSYLVEAVRHIPNVKIQETQKRVSFINNGGHKSTVALFGADNPDSLRGLYFDGIVLDEVADMKHTVWNEVIQPALLDRRGWAVFIGTPKGKGFFYKLWTEAVKRPTSWFTLMLKASESKLLSQDLLDEYKVDVDEDTYEQEMECSFTAGIKGAMYPTQLRAANDEGRLTGFSVVMGQQVHCAFDLGWRDATAVCFYQLIGGELRVVDYQEWTQTEIAVIVREIRERKYKWGTFWLPHDARAKSLQTGKSMVEIFWSLGIQPKLVPELGLIDGIQAVRNTFSSIRINADKCDQLIQNLMAYKKKEIRPGEFSRVPDHDSSSHGADAFRYMCLAVSDRALDKSLTISITGNSNSLESAKLQKAINIEINTGWTLDMHVRASERNRGPTLI